MTFGMKFARTVCENFKVRVLSVVFSTLAKEWWPRIEQGASNTRTR